MPQEEATFQFILCLVWKPCNTNFWVKICLVLEGSKIIEPSTLDSFSYERVVRVNTEQTKLLKSAILSCKSFVASKQSKWKA